MNTLNSHSDFAHGSHEDSKEPQPYLDLREHIADELRRLDLLLRVRMLAIQQEARKEQGLSSDVALYISDAEAEALLAAPNVQPDVSSVTVGLHSELAVLDAEIQARSEASMAIGLDLPLIRFSHIFGLSKLEFQAIIICLAPELHRKYDRLYAYLQDDITRKRPSIDLILSLVCETDITRWHARTYFTTDATLFLNEILLWVEDFQSPSGCSDLGRFVRLNPRFLRCLLDSGGHTQRPDSPLMELVSPNNSPDREPTAWIDPAVPQKLAAITQTYLESESSKPLLRKAAPAKLILHLYGPFGIGKQAVALDVCRKLRCRLLILDLEMLPTNEQEAESILRSAFREGLILSAALYFANTQTWPGESERAHAKAKLLVRLILEFGSLVFLSGQQRWTWCKLLADVDRAIWTFHAIELSLPDSATREKIWCNELTQTGWVNEDIAREWSSQLASQLRFTPGQIRNTLKRAFDQLGQNGRERLVKLTDIYHACHLEANHKLGELARRISIQYDWNQLVLPKDKQTQLKEICSQARQYQRVYSQWGFAKTHGRGKGLSVLFCGPPGTGKTMSAEVIAHELELELYKIDLANVISKYIGETEKNLNRIFQEAEASNAVLLFDEADALFGKRTAVSDAHDRYANIEISYLLQKMEEYEGIVILATNLRENLDEAFVRRLRFIVEFPFPDEISRQRIWETHFPPQAPLSPAIDYANLASRFNITGGNIRNIVLHAAFLAAEDGNMIQLQHILRSAKREFEKMGTLWSEG